MGLFIGKSDASKNLIGCIDEPFKPTPPVFNKVILPTKIPVVDTEKPLQKYIDLGSRFDKPMISMYLKNTQGEIEDTINLVYQFEGDRDSNYQKTRCQKFKGYQVTYCAMVSDSNASEVCACQQGQCRDTKNESISLLGCVPRPTPKDSKIELKATYADNVIQDGQIFPSMNVKFYDTANKKYLKLSIEKLMEFYGSKQVLPEGLDNQGDNNGKDAWDYRQDSKKVYGVTFNSMIPEKIEKEKGEMEKINVFSPDALLQLSKSDANPEGDKKCEFYAESTDDLEGGNPFVLPAQNAS